MCSAPIITKELSEGFQLLQDAGPIELRKREEASVEAFGWFEQCVNQAEIRSLRNSGQCCLSHQSSAAKDRVHGALSPKPVSPETH